MDMRIELLREAFMAKIDVGYMNQQLPCSCQRSLLHSAGYGQNIRNSTITDTFSIRSTQWAWEAGELEKLNVREDIANIFKTCRFHLSEVTFLAHSSHHCCQRPQGCLPFFSASWIIGHITHSHLLRPMEVPVSRLCNYITSG